MKLKAQDFIQNDCFTTSVDHAAYVANEALSKVTAERDKYLKALKDIEALPIKYVQTIPSQYYKCVSFIVCDVLFEEYVK